MTTFKRVDAARPDVINASLRDAENKLTAAEDRVTALEEADIDLAADVTGTLPIANGGTANTTATAAFDALAPTTTQGDTIYHNGTDNVRLAKGTAAQLLRMNSGATAPEWGVAALTMGGLGGAILTGSTTWNPGDIAHGAYEEKDVTVTGAADGMLYLASFSGSYEPGSFVQANYKTTNTASVVLWNFRGSLWNPGSGTVRVWAIPTF